MSVEADERGIQMKIIFCSNYCSQTKITTNMLSTAVLSDILYDKKGITLQVQAKQNKMEMQLLDSNKRKSTVRKVIGIDSLVNYIIEGRCTKELFRTSCFSLMNPSVRLIPSGNSLNIKNDEETIADSLCRILRLAEELYEMVYLDVGIIPDKISEILYQEADMIVMCLNQSKHSLDDYFRLKQIRGKTAYIISNYDKYSSYSKEQLIGLFPESSEENTFFVPQNMDVENTVSESKLFTYFYQNITCDMTDINYEYIQSILKLARYINR